MTAILILLALIGLALNTLQWLLAVDQWANTYWWIDGDGWGMADEAISARALRCHLQGLISDRPMRTINAIFFWQRDEAGRLNHCYRAWRAEIERRQLPDHYRLEATP